MASPDAAVFDLERFVKAQNPVYDTVLHELDLGLKLSHWMWFVFPQLRGLGRSPMAQHYGIVSLPEARAYLAHPVLGPRLRQCVEKVLAVRERSLFDIFGMPDDMKFRSSMTLFAFARPQETVFQEALDRFCEGHRDPTTLHLLADLPLGK